MTRRLILLILATALLAACRVPSGARRQADAESLPGQIGAGEDAPAAKVDRPSAPTVLLAIWRDEEDGGSLHRMDSRTGADLPGGAPIFLGGNYWHGLSPDGRTLAVVSLPQGGSPVGGNLALIDLETWSVRQTTVGIDLWPTAIVFSRDGSVGVIGASTANQHRLVVFDTSTGGILAENSPDFDPLEIGFTPNGRELIVYGARYPGSPGINPTPIAARIDASDLRLEWIAELTGLKDGQYVAEGLSSQATHDASVWWHPAVVFTPETQKMILVHADAELLTQVDFASGSIRTVAIRQETTWLERLLAVGASPAYAKELNGVTKAAALSADGRKLYVVGRSVRSSQDDRGNLSVDETSLGLKVIDVESASVLGTLETQATGIDRAPDGRHFLLGGWSNEAWTDVLDGETLEVTASLPLTDLDNLLPVAGGPLIAAAYARSGGMSRIVLIDTTTWQVVQEWTTPGYAQVWHASQEVVPAGSGLP